jgi:hypothetical protein
MASQDDHGPISLRQTAIVKVSQEHIEVWNITYFAPQNVAFDLPLENSAQFCDLPPFPVRSAYSLALFLPGCNFAHHISQHPLPP